MQYFGFDRPSFAFKTYGFGESSPKLQADFTTGTYKADGATKTFADLFTFNRAGKAWLVEDAGLQEYAADVPRFDSGLLIEQSATNVITDSFLNLGLNSFPIRSTDIEASPDNLTNIGQKVILDSREGISFAYKTPDISYDSPHVISVLVSKPSLSDDILLNSPGESADALLYRVSDVRATKKIATQVAGLHMFYGGVEKPSEHNGRYGIVKYIEQTARSAIINLHALQFESGDKASSFILTEATPVTRPADYLLNNITGTTVTGDWDSTLTLSIVNGQLVHSGYGRIRSLEIN